MKKILIIFGAIVLFLLFFAYTSATELYSQTNHDTGFTITNPSPANRVFVQSLGTGLTGSIDTISIYVSGTNGLSRGLSVQRCDNSNFTSCTNQVDYDGDASVVFNGTAQEYSFSFTAEPITFETSKYYWLKMPGPGSGSTMTFYGNSSGVFYTNGQSYDYNGTTLSSSGTVLDYYFSIDGDFSNSIEIIYPEDGSTNNDNFGLWRVEYTVATTTTPLWVDIFVNTTSTVSETNYLWFDQEIKTGSTGFYSTVLNRTNPDDYSSSTIYYAIAYLYTHDEKLAESTVVDFTIADVSLAVSFPSFDIVGAFGDSGLAEPILCSKAPFAYFCDLRVVLTLLNATSSTDQIPSLSIVIPKVDGSGTSTLALISATNINATLGASNVAILRNLLLYGIWISVGVYVIERIKHHKW